MKSDSEGQSVTFIVLQERLLSLVNSKVNTGEFTERGLARIIGISQPQIHNILKRKRRLQTAVADRMLQRLKIGLLDLLTDEEMRQRLVTGGATSMLCANLEGGAPLRKGPKAERHKLRRGDLAG